jgi:anthranilate synthase component 1
MNIFPRREDFLKLATQGNVIPVYADLMADFETPVSAYAKLKAAGPSYLLESVEGGEQLSRYSFIGCRPRKIFICGPQTTEIRIPAQSGQPARTEIVTTPQDPLTLIEAEMAGHHPVSLPGLPRFTGGAVGFIGYEYVTRIEPSVPAAAKDELGMPLLYFMLSDSLLIFDRAKQTLRLCVNAHLRSAADPATAYDAAVKELQSLYVLLSEPRALAPAPLVETGAVVVPPGNLTQAAFEAIVESTQEFIRSGDIIQIVPSQRFTQPFTKTPLDLYRALRTVNPSPYMFILETEDFAIVGASPEVHVRLTDGLVEIRPIAGTRKRGITHADDLALEKDLLADEKERAEHLMLVDLARNDIGRVCEFGSVTVPEMMVIERYSHVMHLVSNVTGTLEAGMSNMDVLRASFPAGTLTGAPKVRAMQMIDELEPVRRGIYGGAAGYLSYGGEMDVAIAIRTGIIKDGMLYVQAAAGIVADSDPEMEWLETEAKARAVLRAAEQVQNGLDDPF